METDGTERLRVAANGNVGIGTTAPTALLHISGTNQNINENPLFRLSDTKLNDSFGIDNGNASNAFRLYASSHNIEFQTSAHAYQMVVAINGNVGIGTTAPTALLHISGANQNFNENPLFRLSDTKLNDSFGIDNGNASNAFRLYADHNIEFQTGAYAYQMVVATNGNVGIGTATPSANLSIVASNAAELGRTAKSSVFLASGGTLPPFNPPAAAPGITIGSFGVTVDGSNVSLGVRAVRTEPHAVGWQNVALLLSFDVDDTIGAGAQLALVDKI
jgi:hypothetical protein